MVDPVLGQMSWGQGISIRLLGLQSEPLRVVPLLLVWVSLVCVALVCVALLISIVLAGFTSAKGLSLGGTPVVHVLLYLLSPVFSLFFLRCIV